MKIAFFTDTYKPQVNGVVVSIDLFVNQLRKMGHKVHIFCPAAKGIKWTRYVHPCKSIRFDAYPEYRIGIPSSKVYNKIKQIKPDIIHIHAPATIGTIGLYFSKRFGIPVVATYHTLFTDYASYLPGGKIKMINKINRKAVIKYTKIFFSQMNTIISPSESIKKELQSYGIKKQIAVIPTGLKLKNSKTVKKRDNVILQVGRLCKERSIDVLIRAYALIYRKIPHKLIITSDGPERKNLENLVKKLKIQDRVEFAGYVSESKKTELYRKASIFVTPSTTDTQGLVVFEAMEFGTPVIAADARGFKDYIKNNVNGLLFKPNNVKDLADKIEYLLENKKLYRKISKESKKSVKKYSIENCTKMLEKVYRDVFEIYGKKVSVVVCTKNEEKYIEDCLVSLSNQIIRPEIIVVDAHSKDKTVKIAKKYADKIVYDNRKGIADARNVGFANASGDIIAYADADSRPPSNWTKIILKLLQKYDVVSGPYELYDSGIKQKIGLKTWADIAPRIGSVFGYNSLWGANMAFKRHVLEDQKFEKKFLEDYELGIRLRKRGYKMKFSAKMNIKVSSRRFRESFHRLCFKEYILNAIRINLGKEPKLNYWKKKF